LLFVFFWSVLLWLFWKWESLNLFAQAGLEPWSFWYQPPKLARIASVSHWCLACLFVLRQKLAVFPRLGLELLPQPPKWLELQACTTGLASTLFFSFIHMCIQCLGHFSLLPPHPPPLPLCPIPLPPTPSLPGRNYSALISNFVEERV
jgi:hypothetical protein